MIKPFVSFLLLLMLMVFAMSTHFLLFPYKKNTETVLNIISLTHMNSLSLSVNYNESNLNITYPEMPSLSKMDFIYEE